MTLVRYRDFTCAILIDTLGRFLLQQRDNVRGIVHPGKIGLFGGYREDGETYLQCIVREVHEELSYYLAPEKFEYLGNYDATDIDPEGSTVIHGEFFVARSRESWSLRERFSSRSLVSFRLWSIASRRRGKQVYKLTSN